MPGWVGTYWAGNFLVPFKLLGDYLSNRFQRVKIGSKFSAWQLIIAGIPQGSILGPLLFNIFINDIFMYLPELTNFADDNTIDACCTKIESAIKLLEKDILIALTWFKDNALVVNPGKFQLMFLGLKDKLSYCLEIPNTDTEFKHGIKFLSQFSLNVSGNIIIKSRSNVKLLGVTIDDKLKFNLHVEKMCTKAKNSVKALQRISGPTSRENLKLLINTFFMSSFSYCPLIWMFCSKKENNKINSLHKKALKLISPNIDDFEELLSENKMVSVHKRNLQIMMTEIYCTVNKLNPSFLWDKIKINHNTVNLRSGTQLLLPPTNTVTFGMKSYVFRGSILWNYLPIEIKNSITKSIFKNKIKFWTETKCKCALCT